MHDILAQINNTRAELLAQYGEPPVAIRMNKATFNQLKNGLPTRPDFPLLQSPPVPMAFGLPILTSPTVPDGEVEPIMHERFGIGL